MYVCEKVSRWKLEVGYLHFILLLLEPHVYVVCACRC